jgi:predicted MFS family arabinose efflux permease
MKKDRTLEKPNPNAGKRNSIKYRLIFSSLALFILAVGFNTLFTSTSLEKLYVEANISEYRIIGKDLLRKIENGIYYGKNLTNYVGIEKLLLSGKQKIIEKTAGKNFDFIDAKNKLQDQDIVISIAQLDGTILHSDNQNLIGSQLPQSVLSDQMDATKKRKRFKSSEFVKYQDSYYTTLFIRDRQNKQVGIISISLKEKQIKSFLEKIVKHNGFAVISVSAISIAALVILIALLPMDANGFSKRKTSFIIFFIICSSQILSSGYMTYTFKGRFFAINKNNSESLSDIVRGDIDYLLGMGLRLNQLVNMDHYLERIVQSTPELNDITLYDHNNYPLYRATKAGATDFQKAKNAYSQWIEATNPLSSNEFNSKEELRINNQYAGYLSTNTSRTILLKKLFDIVMDSLTVLVISILFLVEMLILVFNYLDKQVEEEKNRAETSHGVNYGMMRPAAFLFLFGVDISISFIPLHMQKLYTPFWGLAKDTIIGLPISAEFMCAGIGILIAGAWLDRRGWHEPFVGGLLLASVGYLYSGMSPSALHFIVARAVVGFGYGLALMAAQAFVINYSDRRTKTRGLANLLAGIFAGGICGAAAGAMLAELIGYQVTFYFGTVILLVVVVYTLFSMRRAMKRPVPFEAAKLSKAPQPFSPPPVGLKTVGRFLSNRIVISLIFFSGLPAAIAVVGFMNYFIPVHLDRIGVSQATIGQVQMIYGICLIYIGPLISKYVDASRDKKRYVFLGCVLGSLAFLIFYILDGLLSAVFAIFLLGLSSSFVLSSQIVYALKLKVTQDLGEGKAIGIFRSSSRIGQMLGPVIFSSLFAATNINKGITFFGLFYLLTAIIFILLTQKDHKNLVREDV